MLKMDFKDTVCRICLDKNIVLDWRNSLEEDEDMTYKDCYYKYTQLKCEDSYDFSSMLCKTCINGLNYVHSFIVKAIDSYKFFMDVNFLYSNVDYDTNISEEETCSTNEFETVFVENSDVKSELQDECSNKAKCQTFVNIELCNEVIEKPINSKEIDITSANKSSRSSKRRNLIKPANNISCQNNDNETIGKNFELDDKNICVQMNSEEKELDDKKRREEIEESGTKGGRKRTIYSNQVEWNTPRMCSFCSKILVNKYKLEDHEKTHTENRERTEECQICGLKFFNKPTLRLHMRIHDQKREKKHKCEYCDKDFYDKGALNVHRRIHLGQMIPCSICGKEYYRQCDLNAHMLSHPEVPINCNKKRRTKYFVRCTECDKEIRSTSYRSHMAFHLKEPLVKCLICDKGFYARDSCVTHVRKVHKKPMDKYNDFMEVLEKGRLSHLLLKQTTEVKETCED